MFYSLSLVVKIIETSLMNFSDIIEEKYQFLFFSSHSQKLDNFDYT